MNFSILVPIYNEERAIKPLFHRLFGAVGGSPDVEIIAIDDGSTDTSGELLAKTSGIYVITLRKNQGYGAALKAGLRHAQGDWVGIIDADGTYDPAALMECYARARRQDIDMVVGDRSRSLHAVPWYRRPGKLIIYLLARFLVWQDIPDLNSGLRVFKRSLGLEFMHLYPQGFSFTTTITLAALTSNYFVEWMPITYAKRIGTSQINFVRGLFHTFPNFLVLIIRIVTYFNPLRFFAVPTLTLFILGFGNLIRTVAMEQNITDASLLLLLVAFQIGLMGLVADLIVKSRK